GLGPADAGAPKPTQDHRARGRRAIRPVCNGRRREDRYGATEHALTAVAGPAATAALARAAATTTTTAACAATSAAPSMARAATTAAAAALESPAATAA